MSVEIHADPPWNFSLTNAGHVIPSAVMGMV
jgi:hypothetical protein